MTWALGSTYAAIAPHFMLGGWFTTAEWARAHPDVITRFVRVIAEASTYVDAHTVPFLIVQGARDPQVWPEQSKRMQEALDKAGIESSLLLLNGQGHGFQGNADRLAWAAAKAFLEAHLLNGSAH